MALSEIEERDDNQIPREVIPSKNIMNQLLNDEIKPKQKIKIKAEKLEQAKAILPVDFKTSKVTSSTLDKKNNLSQLLDLISKQDTDVVIGQNAKIIPHLPQTDQVTKVASTPQLPKEKKVHFVTKEEPLNSKVKLRVASDEVKAKTDKKPEVQVSTKSPGVQTDITEKATNNTVADAQTTLVPKKKETLTSMF